MRPGSRLSGEHHGGKERMWNQDFPGRRPVFPGETVSECVGNHVSLSTLGTTLRDASLRIYAARIEHLGPYRRLN